MKFKFLFIILLASFQLFAQNNTKYIGFIENKGQIIDQKGRPNKLVKYLLNTSGLNVQLRKNGFSYDVYETKKHPLEERQRKSFNLKKEDPLNHPNYTLEYIYHRIDIDFENCNRNVQLLTEGKSSDYDNYYNVAHAPNGILDVHKFERITYQNIYRNIDVVFFIPEDKSKPVEYNFIVKPGGKISDIQLKFKGGDTELIDNKIKIDTRFGKMEETLPMSWVINGNDKKEVTVGYRKIKNDVYGFESSENLVGKKVIIDPVPVRLWGTFYGGESWSRFSDLDIDKKGNICFSGNISKASSIYASSGAHQTTTANNSIWGEDGIIAKFNSAGTRIWGTYYGGIERDFIGGLKTDSEDNIIIAGTTYSGTNISTVGSYKPVKSPVSNMGFNTDVFIAKFDASGVRLWGTYFGDTGEDSASDVDIDNNDNIYIVGGTNSDSGISINNTFQTSLNKEGNAIGSSDAFLSKFNSNGKIIWSTYAGGEEDDNFNTIRVTSNFLVVGGESRSLNHISTPGVFQEKHYNANDSNYFPDGTVYQFTLNGKRNWSTYYGGEQSTDDINTIEVDDENNIYIGGYTYSTHNIATPGSFDSSNPESQATGFFAKINNNGQRVWGSYLGYNTLVNSIKFKNNSIYVCGWGDNDTSITTPCAYRRKGSSGGYVGKFTKNCELIFGTYISGYYELGQLNINGIYGLRRTNTISLDNNNDIIIGGDADENDEIADSNSYQPTNNGNSNFFLLKFSENKINFEIGSNSPICINNELKLTASGGTKYSWSGPNGFTSTKQNPTISDVNLTNAGKYNCHIIETDGCDSTLETIVIIGDKTNPAPTGNSPQTFCASQNVTINDITINGNTIKWYDSAVSAAPIPNTTLLSNGITYYATQTENACESVNRLAVTVKLIDQLPANDYSATICDNLNDGKETISLNSYNLNIIANPSDYSFKYFNSLTDAESDLNAISNLSDYKLNLGENKIYVRTTFNNNCYRVVELKLTVIPSPVINLQNTYSLCEDDHIIIKADTDFDSYLWSTGEESPSKKIDKIGNYSLTVTKNHGNFNCLSTKDFQVILSNAATISNIETLDWTDSQNKIKVFVTGDGDYEYSIDGIHFQDNNEFTELINGEYKIYVRDKNGCGTVNDEVYLLMYPKFFTPNGDGFNDTWKIKFSSSDSELKVIIFDRYNKFIKQLNNNDSWDGRYNGNELPSDDYWFVVSRANGKEYKGHFALKR